MEFNFSFEVVQANSVEAVKSFVKDYFAFIDYSSDNIDSCSYGNVICGESLAVDDLLPEQEEVMLSFVSDLGCSFVQKLGELGTDIAKFHLYYEEIMAGIGQIKNGELEYTAAACYEDACLTENDEWIILPNKRVSGNAETGFTVTDIPFSEDLFADLVEQI